MAAEHIPSFILALEPVVNHYGYFAVGGLLLAESFGLIVPGETTLIAAALFAGLGHLNIFGVVAIGFLAAVIGDNIGYVIGYYGGHPLIERYGKYVLLTPKRFAKAEAFFNRRGGKIILVARFIDGLRQANGIIAGTSEMKWHKFLVYNIVGAIIWVSTWSTIGYFGSNYIETFLRLQLYVTLASLVGFVSYLVYKRYFKVTKIKQLNKD